MKKIRTKNGYDYYYGDEGIFNIVPEFSTPPEGGYRKASYILAIKGVKRFSNEKEAQEFFLKI
jgi:hypothetical protein